MGFEPLTIGLAEQLQMLNCKGAHEYSENHLLTGYEPRSAGYESTTLTSTSYHLIKTFFQH